MTRSSAEVTARPISKNGSLGPSRAERGLKNQELKSAGQPNGTPPPTSTAPLKSPPSSAVSLFICIGGIYFSFLTWAILQERISTTPYGPDNRIFRASLVINTVQSFLAIWIGYAYLLFKQSRQASRGGPRAAGSPIGAIETIGSIFPSRTILGQYLLVAATQSLSSYCSYASLQYVDYLTLLLAKSCKLLPVVALNLLVYRRKFPLYRYMVVAVITVGVCLFSLSHSSVKRATANAGATSTASDSGNNVQLLGMAFLGANLILDGFYNSTQDQIFHASKQITGPHMMCGLNAISTMLTSVFLLSPFTSQLSEAIDFISAHPRVLTDVVLFGLCGGLGQVFIYYTLERYGALLLVTVTVTRKMFSMLISVVWFNHRLNSGQWAGVLTVFVGIGYEAWVKYHSK